MKNKNQIQINQSNIQDLIDCPRRFQLSSIENISWPATSAVPISKIERMLEMGNLFHSLCHRYFTGIDPTLLSNDLSDPDLINLWKGFLPLGDVLRDQKIFPEIILTSTLAGYKFTAKYDLIAQDDNGNFTIYDWKTSAKPPSRDTLENRAQTILYPYLFITSGARLFGLSDISPSQISMRYFYPLAPDEILNFDYSAEKHQEYTKKIKGWISLMEGFVEEGSKFPLTDKESMCQRCGFRSICDRGIKSADVNTISEIEREDLSSTHFDLGQITEIDY